ncbi:MAG: NUDIX domain-containing protein [Nanoarchaeota archaeon]
MSDYAGVIIERSDHKCLFQLRSKDDDTFPSKWGLFGGHLRKGEKPLIALKRELLEEYKLKLSSTPNLFFCFSLFFKRFYVFRVNIGRNHPSHKLIDGQKASYFFPREMIFKKNTSFPLRLLMAYYFLSKRICFL